MTVYEPYSPEQLASLEKLRNADRRALKSLFRTLEPPRMESLHGEYDAELLDQGGPIVGFAIRKIFGCYGPWIGKAFHPVNTTSGVGYNCFLYGEEVLPKLHMRTSLADSRIDHKKSIVIDYRDHNRGAICWLLGELRELQPSVILGMGVFGPKCGRRQQWHRKIPFAMVGPVRSYQLELAGAAASSATLRKSA